MDSADSKKLCTAVADGDIALVGQLISQGFDINDRQGSRLLPRPPLHQAVSSGNPEMLRYLLANGADPTMLDIDGKTPFFTDGYTENVASCFSLLMDAGADINAIDDEHGFTALMEVAHPTQQGADDASLSGFDDLATELICLGIEVNATSKYGLTALQMAADRGRIELTKILIQAGADISIRSGWGGTALHIASNLDRVHVAQLLVDAGADLEARDSDGKTALDLAREHYKEAVHPILANGQDIQTWVSEELERRGIGWVGPVLTELKAALVGGDQGEQMFIEVVNSYRDKISNYRFDDDFPDPFFRGQTLLHIAVGKASAKSVEALLAQGARVDIKNVAGLTAVGLARNFVETSGGDEEVERMSIEVVEILKRARQADAKASPATATKQDKGSSWWKWWK